MEKNNKLVGGWLFMTVPTLFLAAVLQADLAFIVGAIVWVVGSGLVLSTLD